VGVQITAKDVDALSAPLAAYVFAEAAAAPSFHRSTDICPLSALSTINALTSDGLLAF